MTKSGMNSSGRLILTEMEQKSEALRSFIESNLGEDMPRWARFLKKYPSKLDAIDGLH